LRIVEDNMVVASSHS